jgi:predicted ATPase/class 3 adenylate cyclase
MLCAKCNKDNPVDASFCEECGAKLELICAACKASVGPDARFCKKCGTAIDPTRAAYSTPATSIESQIIVAADGAASEVLEGERKTVTALFADIKGSTELMRDLDPEEARAIIDPALKLMIDAVHGYDGYVVQSTGDGIFALFGAPVAHEDHPQRALHAALALRDELRRQGEDLRMRGRSGVDVRIGINTGEVVMRMVQTSGHTEYSPVGHAINLASRMQSVAPPGGIVVSEETRRLAEGYFNLRGLGPTEVKGIDEAIEVYQVVGVGASHGHFDLATKRGLTKFIGRENELAQMHRALELARSGHGQVVAVMAEAGTGKSRLFHEFKATIPPTYKALEAYSVSHGKASAWLPVLELLRGYFGIEDADDAASRREKLRNSLTTLDSAPEDTLPYLFGLLGIFEGPDSLAQMAPQIKVQRTLDAIKRIVLSESLKQPVVVIFEDLHWIDVQTQALLDVLADSIASARVLLLANYRPEYRHEWTNKSYYSQLRLDPLGGADGAAMLTVLLGEGVELNPLKRMIAERTGGNPFFIEEIVQSLFDEGALVRNGTVKVTRSLSQLRLPPTVQGILAARIDRQPADHKQLLQTLSVIGRESPLGLLSRMASHADSKLRRMLTELRAAEFIYEQPVTGGVEYVFKHALTQEVAYNSLLIERRKRLHEQAGQALEAIFANQLDDHLTQLAHHYSLSDNVDKAVEYLGRAGQQAMQRSAHADAISGLNAAINLLPKLPDSPERTQRELVLQSALGSATIAVKGWAAVEVERAFTRARELCEQRGDPPELFPVLFGLFSMYYLRDAIRTAYELAEQLLLRAQSAHDPALLMYAHVALGDASSQIGELLLAREHLEKAIPLYDFDRHRTLTFRFGVDAGVNSLSYAARTLWLLGYPGQALKRGKEALALARDLSQPQSVAFAENFLGALHLSRGEARAAQVSAEALNTLSAEHGFILWSAVASIRHGGAVAEQGCNEEGITQIEEGLAAYRATGTELGRPENLCRLAKACLETDRLGDGLDALFEALTIADEHEDRNWEPEIYRLKGELLLKQNHSDASAARNCFQRAIEIARKQSAKSWELRATMSLARLLRDSGRRDEARSMLAEIYNWFTEGFDTADLKDAKALLDELGGTNE